MTERLPDPGGDADTWGDILNRFLEVEHNVDGTLKRGNELSAKADDTGVVHKAGSETVTGDKNFTGAVQHNGHDVVDTTDARLSDSRQMALPSGDVSFNSHKATNVADPTGSQDAATKHYVDTQTAGLSVAAASTATTGTLATATVAQVDATAANATRTLPAASGTSAGTTLVVKKVDSSTHTVTVVPTGSD